MMKTIVCCCVLGLAAAGTMKKYGVYEKATVSLQHGRLVEHDVKRIKEFGDRLEARVEPLNVTLDLKRHTAIFDGNYKEMAVVNGTPTVIRDGPPECLYNGPAYHDDGSLMGRAIFSMCQGLKAAVIGVNDESYEVHYEEDLESYVLVNTANDVGGDTNVGEDAPATDGRRRLRGFGKEQRRLSLVGPCDVGQKYYIRSLIFNDDEMMNSFSLPADVFAHSAMVFAMVHDLYYDSDESIFSNMTGMGIEDPTIGLRCTVQPTMASQFYWSSGHPTSFSDCNGDSGCLLSTFAKHALQDNRDHYLTEGGSLDNVILFSGQDFQDDVIGHAYTRTMCDEHFSASVNMIPSLPVRQAAVNVAKSMGHNLGMDQADSGIMASPIPSAPSGDDLRFAADSKFQLTEFLGGTYWYDLPQCLDDSPWLPLGGVYRTPSDGAIYVVTDEHGEYCQYAHMEAYGIAGSPAYTEVTTMPVSMTNTGFCSLPDGIYRTPDGTDRKSVVEGKKEG